MPINVYWDTVDKTVLYVKLALPWDWNDFHKAVEEAMIMLNGAIDTRVFLVDVRDAGDLPPAGFLIHSRRALQELPPLAMIFIANTDVMRTIFSPITHVLPTRRQFFFVHSPEEARAIAASTDILPKKIS